MEKELVYIEQPPGWKPFLKRALLSAVNVGLVGLTHHLGETGSELHLPSLLTTLVVHAGQLGFLVGNMISDATMPEPEFEDGGRMGRGWRLGRFTRNAMLNAVPLLCSIAAYGLFYGGDSTGPIIIPKIDRV